MFVCLVAEFSRNFSFRVLLDLKKNYNFKRKLKIFSSLNIINKSRGINQSCWLLGKTAITLASEVWLNWETSECLGFILLF